MNKYFYTDIQIEDNGVTNMFNIQFLLDHAADGLCGIPTGDSCGVGWMCGLWNVSWALLALWLFLIGPNWCLWVFGSGATFLQLRCFKYQTDLQIGCYMLCL